MSDIHLTIRLARAFGTQVQEALSPAEFREACYLNKAKDEPGVCHSHDHCDANMLMLEAFREVMGRDPSFLMDANDEADMPLWNDAWEVAKAAEFFS